MKKLTVIWAISLGCLILVCIGKEVNHSHQKAAAQKAAREAFQKEENERLQRQEEAQQAFCDLQNKGFNFETYTKLKEKSQLAGISMSRYLYGIAINECQDKNGQVLCPIGNRQATPEEAAKIIGAFGEEQHQFSQGLKKAAEAIQACEEHEKRVNETFGSRPYRLEKDFCQNIKEANPYFYMDTRAVLEQKFELDHLTGWGCPFPYGDNPQCSVKMSIDITPLLAQDGLKVVDGYITVN